MNTTSIDKVFEILKNIPDPEVPILNVLDLGIVKKVYFNNDVLNIDITPTYTGCPAMDVIRACIKIALNEQQIFHHQINLVLEPAWTTDWITNDGKEKLKKYGIAPPQYKFKNNNEFEEIECPHCGSTNTILLSQFGSTACKALMQCNDCKEPFDYFKCH